MPKWKIVSMAVLKETRIAKGNGNYSGYTEILTRLDWKSF